VLAFDFKATSGAKEMEFLVGNASYTYLHTFYEILFVIQQLQTWRQCDTSKL